MRLKGDTSEATIDSISEIIKNYLKMGVPIRYLAIPYLEQQWIDISISVKTGGKWKRISLKKELESK